MGEGQWAMGCKVFFPEFLPIAYSLLPIACILIICIL